MPIKTDGNTSIPWAIFAIFVFVAIDYFDPLGVSTSSDQVSRSFTQRATAYCYDPGVRDRLLVLLIRGKELASIKSGWPMRLDVYANYLDWLAEYEPAAVFLDIGLIKGGSIGSLEADPCKPVPPDAFAPVWLHNFSQTISELSGEYHPVALERLTQTDSIFDWGSGRIPLLLASANPLLNEWLAAFKPYWEPGAADHAKHKMVGSADLLPSCLNELGTAVPTRWKHGEGYPIRIATSTDNRGRYVYEPSAAYLLFRLYCDRQQYEKSKGQPFDDVVYEQACGDYSKTLFDDLPDKDTRSKPIVIDWGRLLHGETITDEVWHCNDDRTSFIGHLFTDLTRGAQAPDALLELCPYHPTIPYVFGEAWPNSMGDPEKLIGGKIVIIGTDIPGYLDRMDTPVHGSYPGPLVHAMVVDNLLQQGDRYLKPAGIFNDIAEVIAIALALGIGVCFRSRHLIDEKTAIPTETSAGNDAQPNDPDCEPGLARRFRQLSNGFERWYKCGPPDATSIIYDVQSHNCKVQEMAFKLATLSMLTVFLAYAAIAYAKRIDPVFDFVLPAFIAAIELRGAILPAIAGSLAGIRQFMRHLPCWRTVIALAITPVVVYLLLVKCEPMQQWEIIWIAPFIFLTLFWLIEPCFNLFNIKGATATRFALRKNEVEELCPGNTQEKNHAC